MVLRLFWKESLCCSVGHYQLCLWSTEKEKKRYVRKEAAGIGEKLGGGSMHATNDGRRRWEWDSFTIRAQRQVNLLWIFGKKSLYQDMLNFSESCSYKSTPNVDTVTTTWPIGKDQETLCISQCNRSCNFQAGKEERQTGCWALHPAPAVHFSLWLNDELVYA